MNRNDTEFLQRSGDRMRERRMARNLSRAQLAELCDLHRAFHRADEYGEWNVALLSLRKIARALRTTLAELLVDPGAPTVES